MYVNRRFNYNYPYLFIYKRIPTTGNFFKANIRYRLWPTILTLKHQSSYFFPLGIITDLHTLTSQNVLYTFCCCCISIICRVPLLWYEIWYIVDLSLRWTRRSTKNIFALCFKQIVLCSKRVIFITTINAVTRSVRLLHLMFVFFRFLILYKKL